MHVVATAMSLPTDTTTIAAAAELYVLAGLPPIPLWGLTTDGQCVCGSHKCANDPKGRGKHPIGEEWQKRASNDLDVVRDRFRSHHGNIGVFLRLNGLVLIDADGQVGVDTADAWQLPATLTQQSGSGIGAHYIYRFAANQDPHAVSDRKVAPGLDVKWKGQFVAAPSRHHTGGVYRWTSVVPPATLPDWLYNKICKQPHTSPALPDPPSGTFQSTGDLERRARAYVGSIGPAISGSGGHNQTFAAARGLVAWVNKGLSESIAIDLLREYNATCQPPWSERELEHKWLDAKRATTLPALEDRLPPRLRSIAGGRSTPGLPDAPPPSGPPPPPPGGGGAEWRDRLLYKYGRSGQKALVTHTDNLVRILQLDPRWADKIQFDDFRHRITIAKDMPWDEYNKPSSHISYWTDEDAIRMSGWMRREWQTYNFDPSRSDCDNAAALVARTRDFNPVRDYLGSVSWDGTARLSTWLATYLGAEQNEYSRLVGAWWLISAVARIFEPGCKVDTVPILEGPQGLKKSTALKILAGAEYYSDTPIDIGSKDAYTAIQGCWFVELAELESLMKASPSKSKAFFSSSKDRFRRAYAKHERDELRQCIFVGTVNLKEYLNDPTGARRFWPIPCTRIDTDALTKDRDQLWAEAVHEYESGRLWYPDSASDHQHLTEIQSERTEVDAWEGKVSEWLRRSPDVVKTGDILSGALGIEPKDWTRSSQIRVGTIVTAKLGWHKRRVRHGTELMWVYTRTEVPGTPEYIVKS